jgi:cell wall-associated NlpC family hydrolase
MLLRCRLLPVLLLVLVGCLLPAGSADAATQRAARMARLHHVLSIAKAQRGDPYRYGAAGPNRFDCSGLVYFATHRAGFRNVPRTSSAQSRFMHRINKTHLHPGDFMFFTGSGGVYHVGIFVGRSGGRALVLHAPHSGTRVRIDRVWTSKWFAGTLRG